MTQPLAKTNNIERVEGLLYDAQDTLAQVLPQHIDPGKQITVALELVRGDSTLQKCLTSQEGAVSVVQGVVEASQLGLVLTRHLGHAYLVPFKHGGLSQTRGQDVYLAQFMIGYRGFIHLIRKANKEVASVFSRIVFPGEEFDYSEGTDRYLHHKPDPTGGVVKIDKNGILSGFLGAYTMVIYKDGTPPDFEWMPRREIQKRRNAAKAKSTDTPWFTWTDEMVKKTPTRNMGKRMELTPEITAAIVRDEYRELVGPDHQIQAPPQRMQMPRRKSEVVDVQPEASSEGSPTPDTPPNCPEEGHGPMNLKSGKFGDFYGCTKYPNCKKTVKLEEWKKQQAQAPSQEPAKEPQKKGKKITKKQAEDLKAKAGWNNEDYKKFLTAFEYETTTDIREGDYERMVKCIEDGVVPGQEEEAANGE